MRDARNRPTRARGFTLTELLVVIVIIGILVAFILVAAQGGVRRAEEKATLSLITKLETGLAERIEAILTRRGDVNQAHIDIGTIWNPSFPQGAIYSGSGAFASVQGNQRAQVIAQFDLFRAELPDFFVTQLNNPLYPLNFGAALDYPIGSGNYGVPLGSYVNPLTAQQLLYGKSIGVFGATYQAAAGIYKNLGYLPQGYDGTDNNGDGNIDEFAEGTGGSAALGQQILAQLGNHTHITARSEMLYALLVEGVGPLGSVFNRDDFTQKEVGDTDGDGLPEFIDAWGHPIQFFRWPIYYNSEITSNTGTTAYIQKGADVYSNFGEPRQIDPLDPSQTLLSPSWFDPNVNTGAGSPFAGVSAPNGTGVSFSPGATMFMYYFHSLLDPNYAALSSSLGGGQLWDRGGHYARRAFYSRPLILSGGPDGELGVATLAPGYYLSTYGLSGGAPFDVQHLLMIENQASAIDPTSRSSSFYSQVPGAASGLTGLIQASGADDISNQSLASPGGGVR